MNKKSPKKQAAKAPRIGTGKTEPGNTNWKPVPVQGVPRGIGVEVDTRSAGFKTIPNYVASLAGDDYHWMLTGTSAIYNATRTGFSINLRWWDWGQQPLPQLTKKFANERRWHVTWIGAEESSSNNDA